MKSTRLDSLRRRRIVASRISPPPLGCVLRADRKVVLSIEENVWSIVTFTNIIMAMETIWRRRSPPTDADFSVVVFQRAAWIKPC